MVHTPISPDSNAGQLIERLGYAGLIPFVVLAFFLWIVTPEAHPYVAIALSAYGATIASFLGGIHWGIGLRHNAPQRKLAVFEDPNCGYCKRFERDLQKVDNVTVYLFLYPILGQDSSDKARNIWCAKDKAKAWHDQMLRDQAAPPAQCDTAAVQRNLELGRKHKITGTPTLIAADGTRVPGAINAQQVEKLISQ